MNQNLKIIIFILILTSVIGLEIFLLNFDRDKDIFYIYSAALSAGLLFGIIEVALIKLFENNQKNRIIKKILMKDPAQFAKRSLADIVAELNDKCADASEQAAVLKEKLRKEGGAEALHKASEKIKADLSGMITEAVREFLNITELTASLSASAHKAADSLSSLSRVDSEAEERLRRYESGQDSFNRIFAGINAAVEELGSRSEGYFRAEGKLDYSKLRDLAGKMADCLKSLNETSLAYIDGYSSGDREKLAETAETSRRLGEDLHMFITEFREHVKLLEDTFRHTREMQAFIKASNVKVRDGLKYSKDSIAGVRDDLLNTIRSLRQSMMRLSGKEGALEPLDAGLKKLSNANDTVIEKLKGIEFYLIDIGKTGEAGKES